MLYVLDFLVAVMFCDFALQSSDNSFWLYLDDLFVRNCLDCVDRTLIYWKEFHQLFSTVDAIRSNAKDH